MPRTQSRIGGFAFLFDVRSFFDDVLENQKQLKNPPHFYDKITKNVIA